MRKNRTSKLSLLLLFLAGLAIVQPVPYVVETPGPVFNTLGTSKGVPYVDISGTQTYKTSGELNMTTVSIYGGPQRGIDLFQAIGALFSSRNHVLPREAIYPEGLTADENATQSAEEFSTSQSYAVAAALKYLNEPVNEQVVVTSIQAGMPAHGKLQAGDVIQAVDGKQAIEPKQTVLLIRKPPVGRTVTFTVLRDGVSIEVQIKTVPKPDAPKTPFVGIGLGTLYTANFPITFGVQDVGGPSAGMMFALSIVDQLTPGELTQGKVIAGTGTIEPDGVVGPIGGIRQKMFGARDAGAVLFLAPIENCDEVVGHVPDGMVVTPVRTLSEAVQALGNYKSGKVLPTCKASSKVNN